MKLFFILFSLVIPVLGLLKRMLLLLLLLTQVT